jgi:hypothetical protein
VANLAGERPGSYTLVLSALGTTPNLAYGFGPFRVLALLDSLTGQTDAPAWTDADALTSAEPDLALVAEGAGCFDELFEKVILSPQSVACGFVLADMSWPTHLWNTHRNAFAILVSADVVDSGNVLVDNPLGYPLAFAPFQARDLTTIVPKDGDATIQATLTFVFPGETGTFVFITGSRIVVWGVDPDWTDPVTERTQYLTDIIAAYTAMEQRIALRTRPRTRVAYRVMPTDRLTAAAIEALLYGWQSRVFGVPFWPDAQPLTADTPIATSVVYCDTANRKFRAGGLVALWRDILTHEAATILSVEADRLTTTAPLNATWAADGRTYAIPMLTGRWDGDASLGRLTASAFEVDAAFQCEPAPDVVPAAPATVYGYDVLETEPNAVQDRVTPYTRTLQTIDGDTGKTNAYDRSGVAIGGATGFLWTLDGRAEIAAYRAWVARRRGRQAPFWLPTWQHDLVQALDAPAGSAALVVQKTGYTRYQFPQGARRYLCVTMLDGSGARYYRHVVSAAEGDTTETLGLDSPLSLTAAVAVGSCMVSFLQLVRLASDEPELAWHTRDVAEAQFDCVELPLEVTP